jgi:hypothetical protein
MDKTLTGLFSGDNRQQRLPPGNRFGAKLHSFTVAVMTLRENLQQSVPSGQHFRR